MDSHTCTFSFSCKWSKRRAVFVIVLHSFVVETELKESNIFLWKHDCVIVYKEDTFSLKISFPKLHVGCKRWAVHEIEPLNALADTRGAPGTRPPPPPRGSKFFHFHAVFGKKLKNNSIFGSWRPPWGKSWIRHWNGHFFPSFVEGWRYRHAG